MNFRTLQTIFFLVILAVSVTVTLLMFGNDLVLIALGGVLAVVCHPIYKRLQGWLKSEAISAFIMVIMICVMVLVPLSIFAVALYSEAASMVTSVSGSLGNGKFVAAVNQYLPQQYAEQLLAALNDSRSVMQAVAGYITSNLPGLFANVLDAALGFFIVLFACYYMLKDGRKLRQTLIELSPLGTEDDESIINKVVLAVSAVVNGVVIIAIFKAVLAAFFFWVFGVPQPFFWGAIGAFAALLPVVGIGLVTGPAILYLLLTGHFGEAMGLMAVSVAIIGTIDNFLQPKLVESKTKIHPLLVLMSVLGGLGFYGFSGFILGPLTLAVTMALLDIYRKMYVSDLMSEVTEEPLVQAVIEKGDEKS